MLDLGRNYGPPWGRNPAPKEKWNKFDLPVSSKDHAQFSEEYIHRFVKWVRDQRVTFNINSLYILMGMQTVWGVVFGTKYPLKIAHHTAVYDIVSATIEQSNGACLPFPDDAKNLPMAQCVGHPCIQPCQRLLPGP